MRTYPGIILIVMVSLSFAGYLFAQNTEKGGYEIATGMEPGKIHVGERINLDVQDMDIHNVLRLLAEVGEVNIIVSDKVKGKVTMRLKDIPWDQALDVIVSTYGLGYVVHGTVIDKPHQKYLYIEKKNRNRNDQTAAGQQDGESISTQEDGMRK